MKATLFVKNHNIGCTCAMTPSKCWKNAFLACHHDKSWTSASAQAMTGWMMPPECSMLPAASSIPAFIQAGWRFDQEDHRKALNFVYRLAQRRCGNHLSASWILAAQRSPF